MTYDFLAGLAVSDVSLGGAVVVGALVGWGLSKAFGQKKTESNREIEELALYFRKGHSYLDDEDTVSPFEISLGEVVRNEIKSCQNRGTMVRYRVLQDVTPSDLRLKDELINLHGKGDGRWLGVYLERIMTDPTKAKEVLAIKHSFESKGWQVTSIEPAYDRGDSLIVWVEVEKAINSKGQRHMRAS